ncbi:MULTISPECIES: hypothetical protein [unclassified Roseovarius]|uniref:hypothetical protein n=1 Tax=unclassified Roseovarius TaxID=2614913 RepID=UPI00273E3C47|nr:MULTISPECIES: hypothetical protein [unclassified Roseovarius]
MLKPVEEYVFDIVEMISSATDNALDAASTRGVPRPTGKADIADASLAFFVDGRKREDDIVLLVSNPQFPNVVGEDVSKAKTIVQRVDRDVGHHIAQPVHEGTHDQQTYAAFRRLAPLSSSRLIRFKQKRFYGPHVSSWLSSLALQTKTERHDLSDLSTYLTTPLKALCENSEISPALRRHAEAYLDRFSKAPQMIFTTVEHGDFWTGNVLFERGSILRPGSFFGDFFVIDWRGSALDGYPCIDLVRFCTTVYGKQSKLTADLLARYRAALGLSPFEMGLYCTLGLGRLGLNMDKFPVDRFNQLGQTILDVIDVHGLGMERDTPVSPQDG